MKTYELYWKKVNELYGDREKFDYTALVFCFLCDPDTIKSEEDYERLESEIEVNWLDHYEYLSDGQEKQFDEKYKKLYRYLLTLKLTDEERCEVHLHHDYAKVRMEYMNKNNLYYEKEIKTDITEKENKIIYSQYWGDEE